MLQKKKYRKTIILGALLMALLTGCQETDTMLSPTPDGTPISTLSSTPVTTPTCTLTSVQQDAYGQMILYIQEGFRKYGIEGSYQAYFLPIEEEDGTYSCDILLEGETDKWAEEITYTYDAKTGWYTFEGKYEPIFVQDPLSLMDEDSSFVKETKANYVFHTEISQKKDYSKPIHYYSENGPVENTVSMINPHTAEETDTYSLCPTLYTYLDDRLDVDIAIEYLQIYHDDDVLEEKINALLKKAFFLQLEPTKEAYINIKRNYIVERMDERYLSIRIYEYNDSRYANHPNEGEEGITIDMQTGEVLCLQDVVGNAWTISKLLESGAFHCLWVWRDGGESFETLEQQWMEDLIEAKKNAILSDYDSNFYLTEDSLGLITYSGRYYTCMEAKFTDLGLDSFA